MRVRHNSPSSSIGVGCLILFGSVFLIAGLVAAWTLLSETDGSEERFAMVAIAATFIAAGLAIIALGLYGAKRSRRESELRTRFPGQPWRWQPEWEGSRIRDESVAGTVFIWVFAILWNLIALPTFVLAWRDGSVERPVLALVALFPTVGFGLVIAAIRATLQRRRFGSSHLTLASTPIQPGSIAAGTIHTSTLDIEQSDVHVVLKCEYRYKSGKETNTRVVWQDETTVPRSTLVRGPRGVDISFELPVDADCNPTEFLPGSSYRWWVEASAEVPGVDFDARFHVPVFATGEEIPEQRTAESLQRKR
ncbi:MAG: hypothetical protein R3338_10280, partial [Thermoanaerobaculia bacterium]|nr:hypothetical protein [Thermoanaerobaculia bacterium]